ncbi:MAG: hypothetical protein J6Q68_05535 [Clostridia bacterium]|nr:hypothetical protein [Clostridia bacterium]
MYITRYEAYSMVKDINLSLNDDYALTSLILSILFGVLAFAFCVFAAIAIKRGRIFGILVALLQPVALFAAHKMVLAYSLIDFSSLNVTATGSTQSAAMSALYEKLTQNMLEIVFPQLTQYFVWLFVLAFIFLMTLIYFITIFKAHAKGLAIFGMLALIFRQLIISPIEFVTLFLSIGTQEIQTGWYFIYCVVYTFPFFLIAIQGLINIFKNAKLRKQAKAQMAYNQQFNPYAQPQYNPNYQQPQYAPAPQPVQQPAPQSAPDDNAQSGNL